MKKIVLAVIVLVLTFSLTGYVYAGSADGDEPDTSGVVFDTNDVSYANTPLNKLGRGVINTATCWAEIPADATKVSQRTNPAVGLTYGVAKGVVTTVVRGFFGVVDTVTFLLPPYDKPAVSPEYAYERADENIKDYLW